MCEASINALLPEGETISVSLSYAPQAIPAQGPLLSINENSLEFVGPLSELDAYAWSAGEYLKQHQQDGVDGLRTWLESQGILCEVKERGCPHNITAYNLDSDPDLEYAITISMPRNDGPGYCGDYSHRMQAIYILDCQPSPADCRVYRARRLRPPQDDGGCINGIADINRDGKPEIVITYHLCGASDCWNTLEVVQWAEDYRYRFLTPMLRVKEGCLMLRDQNGDGIREILATNSDLPGSVGGLYSPGGKPLFGPRPPYLLVYSWNGEQYVFTDRVYKGHACQFQYVWEAIERVRIGQIERAISVLQQIVENSDIPESCGQEFFDVELFPWRAYAQYAIGVLNARLGRRDEAIAALAQVEKLDAQGIFTPLADIFLHVYQKGEYSDACHALTAYVNALLADAPFRGPFSASRLSTMCPEDME